jgi:hypothetical protein
MVSKEAPDDVGESVEIFLNQRRPEYGLLQFSAARLQVRHQRAKQMQATLRGQAKWAEEPNAPDLE